MFGRRPQAERRRWERLAVPGRVIIDLGSERSLDMTYSRAADIYAGDVSSQVYEFLDRPKPCVFLNAHGIEWRDNPNFPNWDLGDDRRELLPYLLEPAGDSALNVGGHVGYALFR